MTKVTTISIDATDEPEKTISFKDFNLLKFNLQSKIEAKKKEARDLLEKYNFASREVLGLEDAMMEMDRFSAAQNKK